MRVSVIFHSPLEAQASPAVSVSWLGPPEGLYRHVWTVARWGNDPCDVCAKFVGWCQSQPQAVAFLHSLPGLPWSGFERAEEVRGWYERAVAAAGEWDPPALMADVDGGPVTQGGVVRWSGPAANTGAWYLAELVFAEPQPPDRTDRQCEASNVVFRATSAVEAYRKAVEWGLSRATEPPVQMRLLGVSFLTTIGDELGDGTEVCGRFFRAAGAAGSGLVPPPGELKALQWERGREVPLGELLSPEQVTQLRRAWGQDAEPGAGHV